MLTMGWSDGHTFLPLDFALLSSRNAQINGMNEKIDKRTSGYKRRQEALQSAPRDCIDAGSRLGSRSYSFLRLDGQLVYARAAHQRSGATRTRRHRNGEERQTVPCPGPKAVPERTVRRRTACGQ